MQSHIPVHMPLFPFSTFKMRSFYIVSIQIIPIFQGPAYISLASWSPSMATNSSSEGFLQYFSHIVGSWHYQDFVNYLTYEYHHHTEHAQENKDLLAIISDSGFLMILSAG